MSPRTPFSSRDWLQRPPSRHPKRLFYPGFATQVLAMSLICLTGLSACAMLPLPKDPPKDQAFLLAVDAVDRGLSLRGANAAHAFLQGADKDDPRYDRGRRLLAQHLEALHLPYAASLYQRQIIQERRNLELLPLSLEALERLVASGVYDEDSLITGFLAGLELGPVPPSLQAFVDYAKGLDLYRRDQLDWAEAAFARLPADSPYALQAEYVRAVKLVADGRLSSARVKLEALLKAPQLPPPLSEQVQRTLGRLAFEEGRFDDARRHLEAIREKAREDADLLLELAWTHYYLGDARKTLGYLVALDAPVHARSLSPERYLLEALALRRLCQFEAAREAATRLESRYEEALKALAAGTLPGQIPALRNGARVRGTAWPITRLTEALEAEQAQVKTLRLRPGLREELSSLYARALKEAARREEEALRTELPALTEELLAAREGVQLIVHELGVAMLRGRRKPAGVKEKPEVEVPLSGDSVYFPFDGEFWSDELDDLMVKAEDRCVQ